MTKTFKSFEEFERWTEQYENCTDYQNIPTAIDNGWKLSLDMTTECKNWKTALNRFKKTFKCTSPAVAEWIETMRECCENGYFHGNDNTYPENAYSWGIEEADDACWYIYLNISGIYAGRETE